MFLETKFLALSQVRYTILSNSEPSVHFYYYYYCYITIITIIIIIIINIILNVS